MNKKSDSPEDFVCKENCFYYKPDRKGEDRCRGYEMARILVERIPQLAPVSNPGAFDPTFKKELLREQVCKACPFYIEDCDFTSIKPPEGCLPCGGIVFLSRCMQMGVLDESELRLANLILLGDSAHVSLSSGACIKRLEQDYVYSINSDELYEINEEALEFLLKCDGTRTIADLNPDRDFIQFCASEGILEYSRFSIQGSVAAGLSPTPSLRYLEWLVTTRCNLTCYHCYLGDEKPQDFDKALIDPLLKEFSEMQGLRVLVSGGEPTLYKHFDFLNDALLNYPLRVVLLTNGSTLNRALVRRLNFHEIQISLDGMEKGHDAIRGEGAFQRTLHAMQMITEAGIDLSVATMVHRFNLDEWDSMGDLVQSFGVREWNVDYPCNKGRWLDHPELQVPLQEAAKRMGYAFGGSYHGAAPGWTCGRHLAAVTPSGAVCKCGLFPEIRLGSVRSGLAAAWKRMEHIPIAETSCSECVHGDDCGGGCRFRAGSREAKDDVMCAFHNIPN